jgi:hypothetical protein
MTPTKDIAHARRESRRPLRHETATWQTAALGMFGMSLAVNLSTFVAHELERQAWVDREARYQTDLQNAEQVRDHAVQELGVLAALDGLINAMDAWCDLAQLVPAGDYQTAFNWGDGVLDDPDTRRQDMAMGLSLLNAGIIGPVEYRMRYFGEDEKTARKMLPDMEDMTEDDGQNEIE